MSATAPQFAWPRTFATLLRREWLEHRSAFLAGPGVVLALVLAALVLLLAVFDAPTLIAERLGDGHGEWSGRIQDVLTLSAHSDAWLAARLNALLLAPVGPFHFVMTIISVFALLAGLNDDRRDRSVLFWKSLPVSDTETVLAKLAFVTWIAPLATIAAVFATQLLLLLAASVIVLDDAARLWSASAIWLRPVELLVGYAVHGLWIAPVYGWLLLASAAVRLPFLWAFSLPAAPMLLEYLLFGTTWLRDATFHHVAPRALPRAGDDEGGVATVIVDGIEYGGADRGVSIADSLALLAEPELWAGLVVAAVLIALAIACRRRNNEV